jgi:oligosaccharyltransferase complex subunit beta
MESTETDLKSYGVYNYDNILFFAPTAEKVGSISFDEIIDFTNEGGNVIIAVSKDVSDQIREFVEVFGVSLHKKDTEVIDHFEYESTLDTR